MFKASLRVWKFLMDVVGNTPKSSAIPNFAKSGYEIKGYYKCGQLCGQGEMVRRTANYFEAKIMGLPAKTGFSELFSELQTGGGKLPKQAHYQTEPHPGILGDFSYYT